MQIIDIINKDKNKRIESLQENKKSYPYLERFKDLEKDKDIKNFKAINKNMKRPFTSIPHITYGKNYNDISNKIMTDIDDIITKINEIDLHDLTTDQNYKDKRKLNLFSKMDIYKEKLEKKNSIDSLLINENSKESSLGEEEEKEEEDDENEEKN